MILTFFKKNYLFLFIFFIAFFLRAYRLDYLTTFGYDQGVDFLKVREMVLTHHLTLIGIKVSMADFFQGPLYLYILLPFFWIMNFNPLAGAVAAVTVSMSTLCLLYIVLLKLGGVKAANIGALIFAVSFQFIQYGNTPLYQHFTPLFYILCIYFLYQSLKYKNKIIYVFLTGFTAGLSMELHFLSVSLALASLILLILERFDRLKTFFLFLIGLLISLSPTIIFELKHNFLNTGYFFQYLISSSKSDAVIQEKILVFINGASTFFAAENIVGGFLIFVLICFILTKYNKENNQAFKLICKLNFILLIISLIFLLRSPAFGWWYPLPFWVTSLIVLALYFANHLSNKFIAIIFIFIVTINLFFSISLMNNNHGYYMPPGWSLEKINKVAQTITIDTTADKANFNVISFVDNSRAYSLRYTLEIRNKIPGKITDYNQNNALYVVSSENIDKVINSQIWELKEFSPFIYGNSWNLGDNIFLYRLDKIR